MTATTNKSSLLRPLIHLTRNRLIRGAFFYSFVGLVASGTNILLLPLLTRWMSPEEYGTLSIAMAVLQVLQPLVAVGLGGAVVRYFFEYTTDLERFARFFSVAVWFQIAIVLLLVAAITGLFYSGLVSSIAGLKPATLIPILLGIALVPTRDIGNQLLTARQDHGRASINQLTSFITGGGASLWLVGNLGMGAEGRLYGLAIGAFVAALMIFYTPEISKNLRYIWDGEELKRALRFGIPFLPHAAAMSGIAAVDRLIVRKYLGLIDVGIYSAAMTLAMGTSFIGIAIIQSWYPRFFQLRDQGDWRLSLRIHWGILCILPLITSYFCIFYPIVFPLLLPTSFQPGMSLLPIMAFASFGFSLFNIDTSYVSYRKKTAWYPVVSGVGLVSSLVICLVLVPKHGLAGAAWGSAGGYFAMNMMLMYLVWRMEGEFLIPGILSATSIVLAAGGIWMATLLPDYWLMTGRLFVGAGALMIFASIWYAGERFLKTDRFKLPSVQ